MRRKSGRVEQARFSLRFTSHVAIHCVCTVPINQRGSWAQKLPPPHFFFLFFFFFFSFCTPWWLCGRAGREDRPCHAAATRVAFAALNPSVFMSPCGKCYLLIVLRVAVRMIFVFRLEYSVHLGSSCWKAGSYLLCCFMPFVSYL